MTWRGTLRSIAAAQRRAERESRTRQNELARRQKQLEKMEELERASHEVAVYENHLEVISSVHKDCGDIWDWEAIAASEPPVRPEKSDRHEKEAQSQLDNFKPGVADRLLKRTETRLEELRKAVDTARQSDEREYQEALKTYEQDYEEWEKTRDLAKRILAGEHEAFLEAIRQVDPFSEISELGSSIEFQVNDASLIEAMIHVNSEEVIPKEVKSLTKSGKLSVKNMPRGKFFELYQDYVCACVLRVARETLALLPVEMAIVTALGNVLNTRTGHMEECPILSVAVPRATFARLNFEMIDPSDSMSNFVHRISFAKTKGFAAVERLGPSDLHQENAA